MCKMAKQKKSRDPFNVRLDDDTKMILDQLAALESEKTGKPSFAARIAFRAIQHGLPIVRQEICDEISLKIMQKPPAEKLAYLSSLIHEAGLRALFPDGAVTPAKIDQFIAAEQAA